MTFLDRSRIVLTVRTKLCYKTYDCIFFRELTGLFRLTMSSQLRLSSEIMVTRVNMSQIPRNTTRN